MRANAAGDARRSGSKGHGPWGWAGVMVLGAGIALLASLARPTAAPGPAGTWEGWIRVPASPVRLVLRLGVSGGRWRGSASVPGAAHLPVDRVRVEPPALRLRVRAGPQTSVFEGRLEGDTISGYVLLGKRRFRTSLRRVRPLPAPASRLDAWRQDLDYLLARFPWYDRSFTEATRARFLRSVRRLRAALPTRNDEEIIVALSRAVALSGNAHTRLYLLRNRSALGRIPLGVHWFSDGLYVVSAVRAHRDLLRCRVEAIEGRAPASLRSRVGELFAGNASWVLYKSVYFLTCPRILYGLGVARRRDRLALTLRCPGGRVERTLLARSPAAAHRRRQAWQDLSPFSFPEGDPWSGALPRTIDAVPLYLRHPRKNYWYQLLPGTGVLYFQYNRAASDRRGEPFAAFARRLLRFLDDHPVRKLVVDLRFNTGGDLTIARKTMRRLAEHPKLRGGDRLFAIVGRSTFSAGITHAVQLKQRGGAILVGEGVGDGLDTWSEGGNLVLPNSGLTVHFTTGFHSYSKLERPENRPYYLDLSVDHLEPKAPVRLPASDYFAGRDPALEAVLRWATAGTVH